MFPTDHTVLPATLVFSHKWNEPYLTVFPAEAGPHLLTAKGWKAGLASMVSKQSAQDRCMTEITLLAAQTVMPHWATGVQQL